MEKTENGPEMEIRQDKPSRNVTSTNNQGRQSVSPNNMFAEYISSEAANKDIRDEQKLEISSLYNGVSYEEFMELALLELKEIRQPVEKPIHRSDHYVTITMGSGSLQNEKIAKLHALDEAREIFGTSKVWAQLSCSSVNWFEFMIGREDV